MIDERHEELATLYALDRLEGPERAQFEATLAREPALQALVRDLRETSASLAHASATPPPPVLKSRILASAWTAQHAVPSADGDRSGRPAGFRVPAFIPWALAAGLAVLAAWLGQSYLLERTAAARYRQQHAVADVALQTLRQQLEAERIVTRRQFQDIDQQVNAANTALVQSRTQLDSANTQLASTRTQLDGTSTQNADRARRLADVERQLATARTQVAERERQVARLNERIDALTHASADLTAQLGAARTQAARLAEELKAQLGLADYKIALLASLAKDAPQARAVAVWDPKKQEGLLKVAGLPALAPNQDYQLWVAAAAYKDPLDAGVFIVDPKTGEASVAIKPRQPAEGVSAFAISRERKGGVPKSAGPMLLLGQ